MEWMMLLCLGVVGKGRELVHFIGKNFYKSSLPLHYPQFGGEQSLREWMEMEGNYVSCIHLITLISSPSPSSLKFPNKVKLNFTLIPTLPSICQLPSIT